MAVKLFDASITSENTAWCIDRVWCCGVFGQPIPFVTQIAIAQTCLRSQLHIPGSPTVNVICLYFDGMWSLHGDEYQEFRYTLNVQSPFQNNQVSQCIYQSSQISNLPCLETQIWRPDQRQLYWQDLKLNVCLTSMLHSLISPCNCSHYYDYCRLKTKKYELVAAFTCNKCGMAVSLRGWLLMQDYSTKNDAEYCMYVDNWVIMMIQGNCFVHSKLRHTCLDHCLQRASPIKEICSIVKLKEWNHEQKNNDWPIPTIFEGIADSLTIFKIYWSIEKSVIALVSNTRLNIWIGLS